MATVDQIFTQLNLWKWYSSSVTNYFDGSAEKGEDFSTSYGTPVASPIAGKVVRTAQFPNSIGSMIEVKASDGSVWLFQHLTGKVGVGATINVGTVVGLENGLPVDQYSTGPHIEVRYCAPGTWSLSVPQYAEPWINPRSVYSSIGSSVAGSAPAPPSGTPPVTTPPTSGTGGTTPIAPITSSVSIILSPTADVTQLLATLDNLMIVNNPFDIQQTTPTIGGTSIPDPIQWMSEVGTNVWNDTLALTLRAVFLIMGIWIVLKVFNEFIDYGALMGAVTSAIGTIASSGGS